MPHSKLSEAIKDDTKLIPSLIQDVGKIQHHQDDQHFKVVTDWLSAIDYYDQQADFSSKRQEGTGTWFLESPVFNDWIDGPNTTLFCPGPPGGGKTMLSSRVIDHFRERKSHDGFGVGFLYCNYKSGKERKVIDLLSAVLKQLVQGLLYIPDSIQALYKKHRTNHTRPSTGDMSGAIRNVCSCYPKVFIVVDALDEYPDIHRHDLLARLIELTECNVKLMITSRPVGTISGDFANAVELPIQAHGEDVKTFVEGQLPRLAGCVSRREELKQLVISTIHDAVSANGM